MSYRIVHLADLHLDMPFSGLSRGSQVSNARREGLRQALKQAIRLAKEFNAAALTIGGDLYESDHVSRDTVSFLRQQFENVAPLKVFIAPGNHDPYTHSSPYANIDWSPNVIIFREPELKPVGLEVGLTLWGAGHDKADFTTPLLGKFRAPDRSTSLLLLHGTDRAISLGKDKHAFCPFSEDEIRKAGFSLALLGHIHHHKLQPSSKPFLCYPGSPEPLGFDEEDGHSVLLAEWLGGEWKIESRDISQWLCRTKQIDITDFSSRDVVVERLRSLWTEERKSKYCVVRIELTGQPMASLELDLSAIQMALASDFKEIYLTDSTTLPFNIDELKDDTTVLGVFVRRMLLEIKAAKQSNDQNRLRIAEKALQYGLMAFEPRGVINL